MERFLHVLRTQRWDDHRYYHHSRINQSLHLVSAFSFLFSYVMIFRDPAVAALVGWLGAMTTRQIGHFFFEPHTYDKVNEASHEYKESIKVRSTCSARSCCYRSGRCPRCRCLSIRAISRCVRAARQLQRVRAPRQAQIWLVVGLGGILFRVAQLMITKDVETGLVWAAKIITDPFHDIKIYWSAPYHLLRGELIDPNIGDAWVDEEARSCHEPARAQDAGETFDDRAGR